MYKIRFYCIDGAHYEYLEQETIDEEVTCSTHPESDIRDFVIIEDMNDLTDAIANKHVQNTDIALRTDKFIVDANGKVHINTEEAEALRIGNSAVGVDYKIKFSGNNGDGEIIWQETKDKFKFDCGVDITGCEFVDMIEEYTLDAGVMIEGVLLKDGDLILSGTGAVLTDGVDSATVSEIKDAVTKKHTQNTDTALGAQSENLDMNTHKIVGLVDPTTDQEAATKKYVDDNINGMTYVEDETVSSTTDTAWQEKYSMEFTPPSTGDYLLEWSFEIANSKVGSITLAQIELDDTTQINRAYHEANIASEYCNSSGFKKIYFADTNLHTIDVDFKADADTAMICRVRLSMRKI